MVWGPNLTKAGTKPLKKAMGPCLAVKVTKSSGPLNSPGLAFIARVLSTSKGCVNMVAMVPCSSKKSGIIEKSKIGTKTDDPPLLTASLPGTDFCVQIFKIKLTCNIVKYIKPRIVRGLKLIKIW